MKYILGLVAALVLSFAMLTPLTTAHADFGDGFNYGGPSGYDLPGVQEMVQAFYYIAVGGAAAFFTTIGVYDFFNQPQCCDSGGGGSW